MHLLSSLNSGFAEAANGTAEIYIRGSSTRATVYPDFEASSSDSSGADITLDAYGSALVYVNQLVNVVVKDEDGNEVRSFGDGYSSPNIEVVSPAFTGTDYVTAASAVSEPTTLQAVMNLWATNAGAPDWKIAIGGVNTTPVNAFGALSGLLFNVKSPAYGAVGDGVANDQAAIAAALAAAVAAGGGTVFFPKGTYLITTAIEWDHRVHILGVGADLVTITTNSPSNARLLTWTAGSGRSMPIHVHGISFSATVTNSGDQVYTNVASNVVFSDCYFSVSTGCTGSGLNFAGAACRLKVQGCRFNSNASIQAMWFSDTAHVSVENTRFVAVNTAFDYAQLRTGTGGDVTVRGCTFDATAVTSAPSAMYGIEQLGAGLSVLGCVFLTTAQAFTACVKMTSGTVETSGNQFGASPRYETAAVLATGSRLELAGTARQTGAGAAYTCSNGVEVQEIISTGTVPTVTMPTKYFPGQRLIVIIQNDSAGNWGSITWTPYLGITSSTNYSALATTSLAAEFVVADMSAAGTYVWCFVGGA
jgi:hypothetical protein